MAQIQWFLIFHVDKCYLILVALAKKKIEHKFDMLLLSAQADY
jgi:hypothetical protein